MHYFYIFRCKDGTLYCGYAKDIVQRAKEHNAGRGSKYVWAHGGGEVVYSEIFETKSEALRREAAVKRWPRLKKLALLTTKKPL